MGKEKVNLIVDGGKATAGPPLAPRVSPLGINIKKLVDDINTKTKDFAGIKVPVDIVIDTETKTWEITVGTPPCSQLLLKEIKVEKGSGSAWKEGNQEKPPIVGDVTKEIVVKVAKIKMESMGARTLKNAVKNTIGTCLSAGITVEGKNPKEAMKDVDNGEWDSVIKEE